MLDVLKKLLAGRGVREPMIGHALSFKNRALSIDFFGSPHEVLEQIQARGLAPAELAARRQSKISYMEVFKDQPEMRFSGGAHAESVLELLDALRESDLEAAASILRRDPAALTGAHGGANVPLLAAASAGRLDAVEFLIANQASVDGTTQFDMTPLHWAAVRGHTKIAARLLDAGADGKRLSWFYTSPDELAFLNKHQETARLIAERIGTRPDLFSFRRVLTRMGCDVGR
jgi:hypothetical protein